MATIYVQLDSPLPVKGHTKPALGYLTIFGVRCRRSEIRGILGAAIHDGQIDWEDPGTEYRSISTDEFESRVRKQGILSVDFPIWHRSGRALLAGYAYLDEDTGD